MGWRTARRRPRLGQMAVIDGTHTFTPHLLLDGDFGFTRLRVGAQAPDLALGDYGTQVLGIPGTNNNGQYLYGGIPALPSSATRASAIPPRLIHFCSATTNTPGTSISATLALTMQPASAQSIFMLRSITSSHSRVHRAAPSTSNGSVASASGTSGNNFTSFAEFLLGDPQSISKGVQSTNPIALRWSSYALYAQDTWQLGTKLTINYGMRYEYFSIPTHDHSTGPYEYLPQVPTTVTDSFGTHTVGTVFIGGKGTTPESAFYQQRTRDDCTPSWNRLPCQ